MLSGSKKRGSNISFFIFPFIYFLIGSSILFFALRPIAEPLFEMLDVVTQAQAPSFDKGALDIFAEKDVTQLPDTNDTIAPDPKDLPTEGERYGQILCEKVEIDAPLYYGDSEKELVSGVGTYSGTFIPGAGRTILLAGHNNTYFHSLGELQPGDIIKINTSYGKYEYIVTGSKIALDTDTSAYDLKRKEENLILYTCYPFDMLGLTPDRYFVYADYLSGPKLDIVTY